METEASVAVAVWFDDVYYDRETGEVRIGSTTRIEAEALDYEEDGDDPAKMEDAVVEAIHNKIVRYL